ncbi:MAG: tail fiber protein [Actinomycetota bacterium]|nr:tail fiber protein [Actinomycetota bacterium]
MAEPFLSEIRIMSFNFPPKGWALCNGQLLPINQNQALFSLLGTTYGGNGQTTFALPNLQERVPIHVGADFILGGTAGEQTHTLTQSEMPLHTHVVQASAGQGTQAGGNGAVLANGGSDLYVQSGPFTTMNPGAVAAVGGSQAHENTQPYLVLSFCIALQGIFPSRN